jgi:hypothetical protein
VVAGGPDGRVHPADADAPTFRRVDAELAAGVPISPIAPDVAADATVDVM